MVAAAVEVALGAGLVWARRDGVGVGAVSVAAVSSGVAAASAVLEFVGLGWVVLAGVAVLLLVAVFAAGAFVLAPSSASPVPPVASACACCSAVSRGCTASAMAAMGIVELTMDVHAIAQSR